MVFRRMVLQARKNFVERAVSCPWSPRSHKIHLTKYMDYQIPSRMCFSIAKSHHMNLFQSLASDSDIARNFKHCIKRMRQCHDQQKRVFVTGIGKSGAVAQRLASTLSSISISSQWIHGGEWAHGELGGLKHDDMVIIISHSGRTSELLPLPNMFRKARCFVVGVVGDGHSPLSQHCDLSIVAAADDDNGCPVPSRSIIVQVTRAEAFDVFHYGFMFIYLCFLGRQEAICNALVQHLIQCVVDGPEQFKDSHPGGAIGSRFTS
ncbi:hypothetical protein PsorP6_000953 [Peronosclerospora sorghi]|uniref:Uncharacterized protein n=1 Tax=Peronosclerospora sorghi TaxID=230839 RepID=A0ACC0WUA8_9STRA|nr:hypothetical protein PsorP6_000953 [Peronosclerospora sorghi]